MTNDQQKTSANEHTKATTGSYAAEVSTEAGLESTVISLMYTDQQNPAHNIVLGIAPELGSNLFRFRVGEHDLLYSKPTQLQRHDFVGDFVLWPLPNRVRDKRYMYEGKTYSLAEIKRPQGSGDLIHGLVFDRAWQHKSPIIGPNSASVTTYIDITPESPFYAAYPFTSRLSLTYQLTSQNVAVSYHVENKGNQPLPYGFALHPYFSLLSNSNHTFISVAASEVMEADDRLLPTGRVLNVNQVMYAMFDLHEPVAVGNLKLDHVYTDVAPRATAILDYREQSMQLLISATDDFTHVVVYTLADTPTVCIEHQTCATDAINLHNQGPELRKLAHLLELQPGEVGTGSIHYTVNFR